MKPILTRLFTGIFLLFAAQVFSQPLITNFVLTQPATPAPYPLGTHFVVELRVTNFTNIASMQFPITYNKDAMRFDSLTNAVFPNWTVGNFVSFPAQGKIGVSWDGFTGGANMPFTYPDGTAIFKLHFTGIDDGMSTINISSSAAPPTIDVIRQGQPQPVPLQFQNGGLSIMVGVAPPPPPLAGFKLVANTIYIPPGERGCMPVTVNDFENIIAMNYGMSWDPTVLQFECTRSYTLSSSPANNISAAHFGGNPANGTLVVAWDDPTFAGVSKNDGAKIYDVCFKAIGAPGQQTTIQINNAGLPQGTPAEVINVGGADVWSNCGANCPAGVSAPVHVITNPAPTSAVTYIAERDTVSPGSSKCVSVKVRNFTTITSSEFALAYNPTKLTYTAPDFGANPLNLQASNVTVAAVPPGAQVHYVKFLWTNTGGVTVPNDATIFSACFNVIAPHNDSSNVRFVSTPCPAITGMGSTQLSVGGVPIAFTSGWVRAESTGPNLAATAVSCNGGANGSIILTNPPGATPMEYAWAGPGINVGNQSVQNPGGLTSGTYTVTVTYTGGTTATGTAVVSQPQPVAGTTTINTVSCFNGSNGAINLTPTGGSGTYTYNWAGPGINAGNQTVQDPANLTAGTYTVTITDSNNCTKTVTTTVTAPSQITLPNGNQIVTNVTCNGLSNGSIAITPVGGNGAFTYLWTGGATTKDLNGIAAGTYTVTVTDGNGCSVVLPASGQGITVSQPQVLNSSLTGDTDVKCINTATGTATVTVTGGTQPYSYAWLNAANNVVSMAQNPTNLSNGTYRLIVTDQNLCTSTQVQNVVIANAPAPLTVSSTFTPSPCFDNPSGAIDLTPFGGWQNYTYAWTGGLPPVQDHPNSVPPGTYTVTVTDGNGCTATHSLTVTGSSEITAAPQVQNVLCFGVNNGSIDLNLGGGTQPWDNIVWTNTTLEGEVISNLPPGTYQPTVFDAAGCSKTFSAITITGPDALIISNSITEANPTGAIDITIVSGGTPPFNYQWTGPGGFAATTEDISGAGVIAGDYNLIMTDANSCIRSFSFEVPEGNVINNPVIFSIKNSCDHDGEVTLILPQSAAAHFPVTINWGSGSMEANDLNPVITGLGAGVYNITLTADNGNTAVLGNVQIGQNDPASVNIQSSNPFDELQNGKITLSPFSGVQCASLEYLWAPPIGTTGPQVTGLDSGTYVVTIRNPCSGCTSVETITLNREYAPFVFNPTQGVVVTDPVCANAETGAINVTIQGGNPPYTYSWVGPNGYTSNEEDISQLEAGVYSLTATDENDSTIVSSWTLTTQSNLNITNVNELSQYGPTQVSGANMCDGVAAVVFIPGAGTTNIMWSNGVTSATNNTLCGGAYSVTVTDAAGCSSVWSDALTAPAAIAATQEAVSVKCNGDCDGTAKVFVQGGVAPYAVRWSTGQNDPFVLAGGFSQAVNLCGGTYSVTITDDNDVNYVYTVEVPEPAQIEIEFAATAPRNFNACDGDMLANVTGAVLPITYVWSGSFGHAGDEERAEELCSGEFVEFIITDANGCTAYAADSIPYPEDGCFRVSPIITPGQQDGKNDYVVITCIETAVENHMEIYNRWGQLVFETDGYTNNDTDREHNWNGLTNSGDALSDGVYYYVLSYKYIDNLGQEREETRKGAINLLR